MGGDLSLSEKWGGLTFWAVGILEVHDPFRIRQATDATLGKHKPATGAAGGGGGVRKALRLGCLSRWAWAWEGSPT